MKASRDSLTDQLEKATTSASAMIVCRFKMLAQYFLLDFFLLWRSQLLSLCKSSELARFRHRFAPIRSLIGVAFAGHIWGYSSTRMEWHGNNYKRH